VKVDLPSSSVLHDEASREAWLTVPVVVKLAFLQCPARNVELVPVEREVETACVRVSSQTSASTPQPPSTHAWTADGLEPVQCLYDVGTSHMPTVASGGHVRIADREGDGARPAWWVSAVSLSALAVAASVAIVPAREAASRTATRSG
jgi:hypothetical protein